MLLKKIQEELLVAEIYSTRLEMGKAAGEEAAKAIQRVLEQKEYANVKQNYDTLGNNIRRVQTELERAEEDEFSELCE